MPDFISPPQYIQVNGQVYPVLNGVLGAIIGNNQTVITGVASKIIRVVGFHNYGTAVTLSDYTLKEETSGTVKWLGAILGVIDVGDFYPSGYYELAVGKGLIADVRTTAMYFNIQYIAYTP